MVSIAVENTVKSKLKCCYFCSSTKTRYWNKKTKTKGIVKEEKWRYVDGEIFCLNCYERIFKPEVIKKRNSRRVTFGDKVLHVKENPRIGVCNICRAVVPFDCLKTDTHHEKYHIDNPLKDTLEVCSRCHVDLTIKAGQRKKIPPDRTCAMCGRIQEINPSNSWQNFNGNWYCDNCRKKAKVLVSDRPVINKEDKKK
jgi:hypothetical protein